MISLKKIIYELRSSRSSGHDGINSELLKLINNNNNNLYLKSNIHSMIRYKCSGPYNSYKTWYPH